MSIKSLSMVVPDHQIWSDLSIEFLSKKFVKQAKINFKFN